MHQFDFSVTYNDVAVVAPAPEPSTWALMIAGVGITGAALRLGRRREDRRAVAV